MRILLVAAALLTAACTATGEVPAPAAASTASTASTATTPTGTTAPPTRASSRPPLRTPPAPPVTVDAPCPYGSAEVVAGIVGQRIARTTVTRTRPHPGCAFYRANGEQAAEVAVSVLAGPAAARARAAQIPGATANPVDGVGNGGAVAVTDRGAVLAVSTGAALVVVKINQTSSLEATEIARLVVARLRRGR